MYSSADQELIEDWKVIFSVPSTLWLDPSPQLGVDHPAGDAKRRHRPERKCVCMNVAESVVHLTVNNANSTVNNLHFVLNSARFCPARLMQMAVFPRSFERSFLFFVEKMFS